MDDDDLIPDPGTVDQSALDFNLPSEIGTADPIPDNLQASFSPSLDNLISNQDSGNTMDEDDLTGFLNDQGTVANDVSGDLSNPLTLSNAVGPNGLAGLESFGEQLGNNLLSAFVIQPQEAKTATGLATVAAGFSSALVSQIFFYGIIIVVVLAIAGYFDKK